MVNFIQKPHNSTPINHRVCIQGTMYHMVKYGLVVIIILSMMIIKLVITSIIIKLKMKTMTSLNWSVVELIKWCVTYVFIVGSHVHKVNEYYLTTSTFLLIIHCI